MGQWTKEGGRVSDAPSSAFDAVGYHIASRVTRDMSLMGCEWTRGSTMEGEEVCVCTCVCTFSFHCALHIHVYVQISILHKAFCFSSIIEHVH